MAQEVSLVEEIAEQTSIDCKSLTFQNIKGFYEATKKMLEKAKIINNKYNNYLKNIHLQNHLDKIRGAATVNMKDTEYNLFQEGEKDGLYALSKRALAEKVLREEAQGIVKELNDFGKSSYKIIMNFRRKLIPVQELVYDVQDGKGYSYRLNEKEFLEILFPTANWGKVIFGEGDNVGLEKLSAELSLFKITSLGINPTKIKELGVPSINLKEDALYQYLTKYRAGKAKREGLKKPTEQVSDARLYEIYDQIKFSLFSEINNGVVKSVEGLEKKIQYKYRKYFSRGGTTENTKFYQGGDSTQLETLIVENKMNSGRVSFLTLYNAIKQLKTILEDFQEDKNITTFKEKLLDMFTKKSNLGVEVENKAYFLAKKQIDQTLKKLSQSGGI